MADGKNKTPDRMRAGRTVDAPAEPSGAVADFLSRADKLAPARDGRGRLIFALDATMSRQPTWDRAASLQAQMFRTAAELGGLAVQLVYFRGLNECRSTRWLADADVLAGLMSRIDCRSGQTQIERVLLHVRNTAAQEKVRALVFVGDALEEDPQVLEAVAGEIGMLGVKAFMFQEGDDPAVEACYRRIARLTGGAFARFGSGSAAELAALLNAVAAYAAGGAAGLERLASREGAVAQGLIAQMGRGA